MSINRSDEIQIPSLDFSSSSSYDEQKNEENIVFSKGSKKSFSEKRSRSTENKENSSIRYSSILKQISKEEKEDLEEEEEYFEQNDWAQTCFEVSNIVKNVIPNIEVPQEVENQQEFILSVVKTLTEMCLNPHESEEYQKLKEKNKKLKMKIKEIQEKNEGLYNELRTRKLEEERQEYQENSDKDRIISENIQQIKELVKKQKKSQRRLLRDIECESSHRESSHKRERIEKKKLNEMSKISKTKRVPYPESDTEVSSSSSEVYIVRTKPSKHEKVLKVSKQRKTDECDTYSTEYSQSLSSSGYSTKKKDASMLKREINKLIGITNDLQNEFGKVDSSMSISKLSMIHDSLIKEEKKYNK